MLHLFNTLSGILEPFKATDNKNVKMYTCGPSTYQRPHIGNYRTFLFEDILQRYLEYQGYRVERLMTLTDVEDKAISEAKKENVSLEKLTSRNEAQLFKDFELLKIKVPSYTVQASTAVAQAVNLVKALVEKGYAYFHTSEGRRNVYFDPKRFKGFGKLAHIDMNNWPMRRRRFHKDTYPGTPWNRGDFIVWHGCKNDDACWDAYIGRGRPAWNIQDAAIVTKHLGFHVDIAAGGIDNLVRHHDYTLAVAESVSGERFANYWLHGAHLLVDGFKMSKSRGNVIYPGELMDEGYGGAYIRFFLIYRHYRKRLNFTLKKLAAASSRLAEFRHMVQELQKLASPISILRTNILGSEILNGFEVHMNNDLDVRRGFDFLYNRIFKLDVLRRRGRIGAQEANSAVEALKQLDFILKILF